MGIFIFKMSEHSEIYDFLKKVSKGDTSFMPYSRWNLPDPIYDIKYNSQSPASSVIWIEFENTEKYLNALGIDDDEDIFVWNRFMENYYYDDYDYYRYEEDWKEGYIIKDFNPENIRLVENILMLSNPSLSLDINNDESCSNVSLYLSRRFDDIDYIISEFGNLNEDCKRRAVVDVLDNETKNPFRKFGITEIYKRHRFKTTVNVLLHWYNVIDNKELDLIELLQELLKKFDNESRGNWYELEYNVWCDDFDNESFQKETKRNLEKIIENLEESIEGKVDLETINSLYNKVISLGGFGRWINIKEKKAEVNFRDLDTKKGILKFYYRSPQTGKATEERSVKNLEELNLSLYQPELFEHVKKIKKIIL